MANVTTEIGIYDNPGEPNELHCIANVTYDDGTMIVSRIENWENTYPFAWLFSVTKAGGATFSQTIAANSSRNNRLNVGGGFTINDPWTLTRA